MNISNQTAKRVISSFFIAGLTLLFIINVQPWIGVVKRLLPTLTFIPFADTLVAIPYLGGIFLWIGKESVSLIAAVLCIIILIIELLPLLFRNNPFLEKVRAVGYIIEFAVCFLRFPPYAGGVNAFFDDFWQWDSDLIDYWNLFFLCFTFAGLELAISAYLGVMDAIKSKSNKAKVDVQDLYEGF